MNHENVNIDSSKKNKITITESKNMIKDYFIDE